MPLLGAWRYLAEQWRCNGCRAGVQAGHVIFRTQDAQGYCAACAVSPERAGHETRARALDTLTRRPLFKPIPSFVSGPA